MVSLKPTAHWKRAILNVVIVFHLLGLFLWCLPSGPFRNHVTGPWRDYFRQVGLWHSWNMFAPKPLAQNFDVTAEVRYADGSKKTWVAPRVQEYGGFEKLGKERYRKWRERIKADNHRIIWDDTGRWIARQMNTAPGNPPVEVKMTRSWTNIPKPARRDYQPMPPVYAKTNSFVFCTLAIRPMDLK